MSRSACTWCHGRGTVGTGREGDRATCDECGGNGEVWRTSRFERLPCGHHGTVCEGDTLVRCFECGRNIELPRRRPAGEAAA